ncbi:uncharacterized protein B0H18DRAFT_847897, partial [Fomitopsis serialis]|uniref:uncharacterized protein n=1 Tax=Fomitopsis serialis TaxID=139415 RepID=UPI002008070A
NFDELAVSFITETLQTMQPSPRSDSPPAAAAPKVLLAARQKRLEQHIAETKVLMAKLTTARSKAEKENILGMLRERQR